MWHSNRYWDALDELGLRVGDTAMALVKATETMVIKD